MKKIYFHYFIHPFILFSESFPAQVYWIFTYVTLAPGNWSQMFASSGSTVYSNTSNHMKIQTALWVLNNSIALNQLLLYLFICIAMLYESDGFFFHLLFIKNIWTAKECELMTVMSTSTGWFQVFCLFFFSLQVMYLTFTSSAYVLASLMSSSRRYVKNYLSSQPA